MQGLVTFTTHPPTLTATFSRHWRQHDRTAQLTDLAMRSFTTLLHLMILLNLMQQNQRYLLLLNTSFFSVKIYCISYHVVMISPISNRSRYRNLYRRSSKRINPSVQSQSETVCEVAPALWFDCFHLPSDTGKYRHPLLVPMLRGGETSPCWRVLKSPFPLICLSAPRHSANQPSPCHLHLAKQMVAGIWLLFYIDGMGWRRMQPYFTLYLTQQNSNWIPLCPAQYCSAPLSLMVCDIFSWLGKCVALPFFGCVVQTLSLALNTFTAFIMWGMSVVSPELVVECTKFCPVVVHHLTVLYAPRSLLTKKSLSRAAK